MEYVKLNNGVEMPILGFGVYQIKDLAVCERSVLDAIEAGYRSIDTASLYGNEEAVGQAIKKSGVDRKSIFLTTKLWIDDTNYENARKSFERSLNKLQTDYLDLYLIHQPYADVYGAWRAMEELYLEGKIKAIGVSNFYPDRLVDFVMHNKVKPAINQIETHPFHQQIEAKKIHEKLGVQIQSWGPFAEGKNDMFSNEFLHTIAKKHNVTIAQVILRWLIDRGIVAIPKSVRKEKIIENFNVFGFSLDTQDMEKIALLDQRVSAFFDHRDPKMVDMIGKVKLEK